MNILVEHQWQPSVWYAEKVDSITINAKQHKRIQLFLKTDLPAVITEQYWIENIGSSIGPIYNSFFDYFEGNFDLHCYKIKDKKYWRDCYYDAVEDISNESDIKYNH